MISAHSLVSSAVLGSSNLHLKPSPSARLSGMGPPRTTSTSGEWGQTVQKTQKHLHQLHGPTKGCPSL